VEVTIGQTPAGTHCPKELHVFGGSQMHSYSLSHVALRQLLQLNQAQVPSVFALHVKLSSEHEAPVKPLSQLQSQPSERSSSSVLPWPLQSSAVQMYNSEQSSPL
jgi:hypothetical protein